MKNLALLFFFAIPMVGCGTSDSEVASDFLETAAYEESVLSQLPRGDSKFDMAGSGTAASLGLPNKASCPEEIEPLDREPATETDETDSASGTEDEADSSSGTGDDAGGTDPASEANETDSAADADDEVDEADSGSGTDEASPTPEPNDEMDEPGDMEIDPTSDSTPMLVDTCAEAVAETPWKEVYDLELGQVRLPDDLEAPSQYPRPSVSDVGLGGTEFWQKWSGGENPTFNYSLGSDYGRRCMVAAALRFQLIMIDPPESILELKANTNWGGSFFNWVDDFGGPNPWGSASGAKLWAWRTGLIKWISQASADGTCYLPTYSQVEGLAAECLARAAYNGGEIQGCRN